MSIHQRSTQKGKVYEVRLRGPDGREVSRTFRTKRKAVEYEAAQRTAKARGSWVDPRGANVTLAELSAEWLQSNPAKRQSTLARDESALRVHVRPVLGQRKIGSLAPGDIRALVTDWSLRMAPRTVRRMYGTVRAVLNYGVETDLILRSPCRGIRLPAVEPAGWTHRPVAQDSDCGRTGDAGHGRRWLRECAEVRCWAPNSDHPSGVGKPSEHPSCASWTDGRRA